jgi:hypothetical protein
MLDRISNPPGAPPTLADLLKELEADRALSATRLRDLRSAVKRVAALLDAEPSRIALDLPAISGKLAAVNPIGCGLTAKSYSNLRSDFVAAVKASGFRSAPSYLKQGVSPAWTSLLARFSEKRVRIGLGRLAQFASAHGIEPADVDQAAIASFIAAVREGSLHRKPNELLRSVTVIWNEVVGRAVELGLHTVTVPSFRAPAKRINWFLLPASFRSDVDDFLKWCSGSDVFDADARVRPLAPQTLRLRRGQIHAAATALVQSGTDPAAITSLAALVRPDALKRILHQRHEACQRRVNAFNHGLANALVQIAREWVKADTASMQEIRRIAGKMPAPTAGLTDKNKRFLRQFDDPTIMARLFSLAGKLWKEVRREQNPSYLMPSPAALNWSSSCSGTKI